MINQDPKTLKSEELFVTDENIMVGIYNSPKKGILLVQRYSEPLHLPGGLIKQETDSRKSLAHLKKEKEKIQRFIFEKSGFILRVKNKFAVFNFTRRQKSFLAFYLEYTETGRLPDWQKQKSFRYIFLQPDEIKNHANIKIEDRQILFYFLKNERMIKAKPYSPVAPIITIAL